MTTRRFSARCARFDRCAWPPFCFFLLSFILFCWNKVLCGACTVPVQGTANYLGGAGCDVLKACVKFWTVEASSLLTLNKEVNSKAQKHGKLEHTPIRHRGHCCTHGECGNAYVNKRDLNEHLKSHDKVVVSPRSYFLSHRVCCL